MDTVTTEDFNMEGTFFYEPIDDNEAFKQVLTQRMELQDELEGGEK